MPSLSKPKIVIDTNVWISGLIFGGVPEEVLDLFVKGDVILVTSEENISELRRKIHQRFPLFIPQLPMLEASIKEQAIIVKLGTYKIDVSRDSDDNKFIETALTGNAKYIISGDNDLLTLKTYKGVEILKPAEFLGFLKS